MNTAHTSNDIESSQATFASAVACSDLATDETLVATAKMGDEQAFETLVKRYRPRILALALRYIRVRKDAEDVVQQTFQKTFVYLSNFEGKSSFSTWLTRIAINEALMCLRRARALREVTLDDLNGDEGTRLDFNVADASPDPEATYMQREEARILSIAIRRLTPRMRSVLELKELRELSAQETTRQMGLSLAAVKARVFDGRKKLRSHIADEAHPESPKGLFNDRDSLPTTIGRSSHFQSIWLGRKEAERPNRLYLPCHASVCTRGPFQSVFKSTG